MKEMLSFSTNTYSTIDLIFLFIKIIIFVFVAVYLFGNFVPFYDGNDSYTLATIAIKISNGEYVDFNELLEKTSRFEFIPGDWAKTIDGKNTFPLGPVGYHFFTGFFYFIGNNYALFYLGPIFGIMFLFFSERIATKLFDKNVGLLTLLFLSTNHLFYRASIHLQVDVIFSLFFVIGSYFFVTFLKEPTPIKIILASTFFVFATLMRINGVIVFPIEIIVIMIYLILNKKLTNIFNFKYNEFSKRKIGSIIIVMIIPWIAFFIFYFEYNMIFFGDPFTNYAIEQRGYENTDAKTISLFLVDEKHFENLKQYAKYLLPYQFPAMESSVFSQFNNILGTFWLGVVSLIILFSTLLLSLKLRQNRFTLIVFTLLIFGTLWFFSSVTSEERAALGVPGRYIMPAFTLFYIVLGYLLVTTFNKSKKLVNSKFWLGKSYRILLGVILGVFFVTSFYFIPPTELIKSNSYEFKNPQNYVEGHPPNLEGLNEQSVIMAIKTDRVLEYDVIPFHMLPLDRGGSQESIDLLGEIIRDDYDVFIFKKPTTSLEKNLFNNLVDNHNFIIQDFSKSFCKVTLKDNVDLIQSQKSDQICLIE